MPPLPYVRVPLPNLQKEKKCPAQQGRGHALEGGASSLRAISQYGGT